MVFIINLGNPQSSLIGITLELLDISQTVIFNYSFSTIQRQYVLLPNDFNWVKNTTHMTPKTESALYSIPLLWEDVVYFKKDAIGELVPVNYTATQLTSIKKGFLDKQSKKSTKDFQLEKNNPDLYSSDFINTWYQVYYNDSYLFSGI